MMAIILCRDVVDHVKQFKAKLKPGILLSGKMFVNFWSTVTLLFFDNKKVPQKTYYLDLRLR